MELWTETQVLELLAILSLIYDFERTFYQKLMSLLIKRISYFYVVLFFIGQNNFVLTNILAVNKGLDIGKLRAGILIIFIIIGLFITAFRFLTDKTILNLKIKKIDIISIVFPLILIFINILIDYSRYGNVNFTGIVPLIECVFFAFYFFINVRDRINITSKTVNLLSLFIFLNILLEIILYVKDLGLGISYGAFRANIAGIDINRNPSFFYPVFAFVILRYASLNYWVKIFYHFVFVLFIITVFYRTIYVALLFPLLVEALRFRMNISIKFVTRLVVIIFLIFIGVFYLDSKFNSEFNFSILDAFTGRFTSTFTDYKIDEAQTGRINQIPEMFSSIVSNPLGIGFSGIVGDNQVYNYAFYFLHPLLYLGLPLLFIYYILLRRILIIYKRALFSKKNRILIFCILYFSVTLLFFPYMNYFTFSSIFIFLLQLSNVEISYDKN